MQRVKVVVAAIAIAVLATLGITAAVAGTWPGEIRLPPIGPVIPRDTGAGEMLLVVVGGVFDSRSEAEAANAELSFGDVQGFYVVPVAQFQGFREQLGAIGRPDDFALVSVFRTEAGAQEFMELAASHGHDVTLLPERVRSLGGVYAGLGQEPAPDGSGPLVDPVEESLP